VCWSVAAGRFRYVDIGNSPRGSSEKGALYLARSVWLQPGLMLLGDAAYRGDERVRTAYRGADLLAGDVGAAVARRNSEYNAVLHSCRVRVEHAFSRLKHTWQLLEARWNLPLYRLAPTFRACALLCNYLLRTRGLY